MERAWLPESLLDYPVARYVLGVVVDRPLSNPEDPDHYLGLYREKVLELVRRSPDWREELDTYLPQVLIYLPSKPSLELVVDYLQGEDDPVDWQRASKALAAYLRGRGSLEEVKEVLRLKEEDRDPVSPEEFLKELKELDLADFLASVTNL
ncbi:MAG: hypothetical protein ABID54_06435 [Pseudomonadota bacterium]